MSSTNSFAALYETMRNNELEDLTLNLDLPLDDTHEGSDGSPSAPDTSTLDPTAPNPASTVITPVMDFCSTLSRKVSWADETQEEVDCAAASEAEVEAEAQTAAEKKEVEEGWATVKKLKSTKRAACKEQTKKEVEDIDPVQASREGKTAVSVVKTVETTSTAMAKAEMMSQDVEPHTTHHLIEPAQGKLVPDQAPEAAFKNEQVTELAPIAAAPPADEQVATLERIKASPEPTEKTEEVAATANTGSSTEAKKNKASRRRKQKHPAKKAQAATISMSPFSEAVTDASDCSTNNTESLQGIQTPAETANLSPSMPSNAAIGAKPPLAVSAESNVDPFKPSAIADTWDEYIETMPIIPALNCQVAHNRESAVAEAQTWFEAGLPSVNDGKIIASDLQSFQEDAEKVQESEAAPSVPAWDLTVNVTEETLATEDVAAKPVTNGGFPKVLDEAIKPTDIDAPEVLVDVSDFDKYVASASDGDESFSNENGNISCEPVLTRKKNYRTKAERARAKKRTAAAATCSQYYAGRYGRGRRERL